MTNITESITTWNGDTQILRSRLTGGIDEAQLNVWWDKLLSEIELIPNDVSFKLLIDERDCEPVSQVIYDIQRLKVPYLVRSFGIELKSIKGADLDAITKIDPIAANNRTCLAVAFVHHDEHLMDKTNAMYSSDSEAYFISVRKAERWLKSRRIKE